MPQRRKGFTLLEALISLSLLAVGISALVWIYSIGVFALASTEDLDKALHIAQAKMEEVKNTSFGSLADSGPIADANFPNFNVSVNVAEGQNPMQVDVTVAWSARGGSLSIVLTTLAANYTT